jgi:hypothetical protein
VQDDQGAEQRVDVIAERQIVGEVHPQHHEVALGEVDDPHDAEDQREADAHERVDAAHEQPRDEVLQELPRAQDVRLCRPGGRRYLAAGQCGVRVAKSPGATVNGSPPCHCTMIGVASSRRPRSS